MSVSAAFWRMPLAANVFSVRQGRLLPFSSITFFFESSKTVGICESRSFFRQAQHQVHIDRGHFQIVFSIQKSEFNSIPVISPSSNRFWPAYRSFHGW
jgi:hypothetical protein